MHYVEIELRVWFNYWFLNQNPYQINEKEKCIKKI